MTSTYEKDNIFAKILRKEMSSIPVYEDEKTFVMMDIMPQSRGHVLVLPKCEAVNLLDLPAEYAQACMETAQKIAPVLTKVTKADGLIFTQFTGAAAGQSVFHVHFHLIPAYNDQTIKPHSSHKADISELEALAQEIRAAL